MNHPKRHAGCPIPRNHKDQERPTKRVAEDLAEDRRYLEVLVEAKCKRLILKKIQSRELEDAVSTQRYDATFVGVQALLFFYSSASVSADPADSGFSALSGRTILGVWQG